MKEKNGKLFLSSIGAAFIVSSSPSYGVDKKKTREEKILPIEIEVKIKKILSPIMAAQPTGDYD